MLLKAIIDTHAWAASRPKHESAVEGQKLEERIAHIMDTEREQGMCSPTPTSETSSSFNRFKIVGMLCFFVLTTYLNVASTPLLIPPSLRLLRVAYSSLLHFLSQNKLARSWESLCKK